MSKTSMDNLVMHLAKSRSYNNAYAFLAGYLWQYVDMLDSEAHEKITEYLMNRD